MPVRSRWTYPADLEAGGTTRCGPLLPGGAGRQRGGAKFSSRPLDIDLLMYGDSIIDEPPLRIPRPDVLEYVFVLGPLAELAPDLVHPETGRSMRDHWQECDTGRHPMTPIDVIL